LIPRLRIGQKLTPALAALLLPTIAVAWVGGASLRDLDQRTQALYHDNIVTTEATSAVGTGVYEAEETAFRLLLTTEPAAQAGLGEALADDTVPAVDAGIATLRQLHAADPPVERAQVERLAAGWGDFTRLWRSGTLDPRGPAARQAATPPGGAGRSPT